MAVRKTTKKPTKPAKRKPSRARKPKRPNPRVKKTVVPAPVIPTVTPVVAPMVVPEPVVAYKEIAAAPASRLKLWLTVGVSMAVIICIWAYSLSQSLFSSDVWQTSSDQMELGNFVNNVGTDLSGLKTDSDAFIDETENRNQNTATSGDNANLDNLFSDLQ